MISVFFNNFTNLVHVYDELDLRKVFEYKDNSFLNDFTDYQLFYISKDKACVLLLKTYLYIGISFAKVGIFEELEEHGYVNNPAIIFLLINNKLRCFI